MDQNLYNYLCEVVGTDKIVEIRRSYFKILESYYNEKTCLNRVVFSGSKAEGLDLPGSDVDIMIIYPDFSVYDSELKSNSDGFIMDTANVSPGFACLRTQTSQFDAQFIVHTENGKVLSNEKFKQYCLNCSTYLWFHLHGPCLSTPKEDFDIAYCLQGNSWPKVAFHWIVRSRNTELPTELISDILREGILLVPIGSKFGSKTDNKNEWRISFSLAEKRLIHSFNHTELLCYALLKIVLKDVFNQNTKVKGLLCSYYLKTVMFWLKEELPSDIWKPHFLLHCFKECLKRLIYWIECGYCPNYFVTENNMFAGKFDNISLRTNVVETLQNICNDFIAFFTNSKALYGFLLYNTNKKKKQGDVMSSQKVSIYELNACVFPLMHISKLFCVVDNCKEILEIIFPILNNNRNSKLNPKCSDLKKFENDLNIITFAEVCERFSHGMGYYFHKRNKMLYVDYNNLLSHLLIGTHSGLTVWLSVALFFYQHKQYNNAIQTTDYFISQTTPDMFLVGQYGKPYSRKTTTITKSYEELSLPQRFKLTSKEPYNKVLFQDTFLHGCDLAKWACSYAVFSDYIKQGDCNVDMCQLSMQSIRMHYERTQNTDNVNIIPETFGHFMRCMCYHHQHDNTARNHCVDDIITSIVNQPEDSCYRWGSFPYLLRALTLTNHFSHSEAAEYAEDISCMKKFEESDYFRHYTNLLFQNEI